jgi:hypothetical protein
MSGALWTPGSPPPDLPPFRPAEWLAIALLAVPLAAVGVPLALWFFSPAHSIYSRVLASRLPYVEVVDYNLNPIYPAESVAIYLRADVTDAQVVDLYCRVVTPEAAAQIRPPGSFHMIKGVRWIPAVPPADDLAPGHGVVGGTTVDPPACP